MVPMAQVNGFPGGKAWRFLATGMGLGRLPVAPGTFGSLLALPFWFWGDGKGAVHYLSLLLLVALSIPAIRAEMRETGEPDPRTAVIDEVCGMLLAATGIPWGGFSVLCLFLLFRLFDVVKVGPAAWLNARQGAVYVLADDLVAGIYAHLAYRGLLWLTG
ncbi:MAG: phosphatidylglycerophosphatase A [Deltaproteobacteria bacterium]